MVNTYGPENQYEGMWWNHWNELESQKQGWHLQNYGSQTWKEPAPKIVSYNHWYYGSSGHDSDAKEYVKQQAGKGDPLALKAERILAAWWLQHGS